MTDQQNKQDGRRNNRFTKEVTNTGKAALEKARELHNKDGKMEPKKGTVTRRAFDALLSAEGATSKELSELTGQPGGWAHQTDLFAERYGCIPYHIKEGRSTRHYLRREPDNTLVEQGDGQDANAEPEKQPKAKGKGKKQEKLSNGQKRRASRAGESTIKGKSDQAA